MVWLIILKICSPKVEFAEFISDEEFSMSRSVNLIKKFISFKGEGIWNIVPKCPLDIAKLVRDYHEPKICSDGNQNTHWRKALSSL